VIEEHRPLANPERVVIAHAHHTGSEFDVPGSLGGNRDED
jgi:hypothetical protein